MADTIDKKHFSIQITKRFLTAMDHIIGDRENGKVTAKEFGDIVGIPSTNLIRLRNSNGEHAVTVEAIGRLCSHYKISPHWLITGEGEIFNKSDLLTAYKNLEQKVADIEKTIHTLNKKGKKSTIKNPSK